MNRFTSIAGMTLLLATAFLAVHCADPLDMTRPHFERGTLGEELYVIILRDLVRAPEQAEAKALAFESHRDGFIGAVDTVIPDDRTDSVESFLIRLLPLWDDDTLPDLVRKAAFIVDDLSANGALLEAWVRTIRFKDGYLHSDTNVALLDRIGAYPRLRELAEFGTELILSHDGLADDGTPDDAEDDAMTRLLLSVRDRLRDPPDGNDLTRTMALVSELALATDDRFAGELQIEEAWAVDLDARGLAAAARDDEGHLHHLFADGDGDGLADIDPQGRYIGQDGLPFWVAPFGAPYMTEQVLPGLVVFRDDLGRARDPNDTLIFEFLDLNRTPLGYVIRRMPDLVQRGLFADLVTSLDGILGSPEPSEGGARFSSDTPILDLSDAAFAALDFEGLPELAEGVASLTRDHEGSLATLLLVMENAADIVEELDCHLEPENAFLDDILPYFLELMQDEGVIADLLVAVQDPVFGQLFDALDDLFSHYSEGIEYTPDSPYFTAADECLTSFAAGTMDRFECLRAIGRDEIFDGPTDPVAVNGTASVSLSQELVHLIYVASETPFDMVIESISLGEDSTPIVEDFGPIIHVPDTAASFFDSVVGNFCLINYVNMALFEESAAAAALVDLADLLGLTEGEGGFAQLVVDVVVALSDQIGVHLDPCPTANQTLRFFNLPDFDISFGPVLVRLAPPRDGEGFIFSENVVDSLIAAEATGVLEALHPVLRPVSDRGLSPLVGRLVGAMYRHYPVSGQAYLVADGTWADLAYSGIRRYETALLRIFRDGRLMGAIQEIAQPVLDVDLTGALTLPDVAQELVVHVLDPAEGLADRRGQTTAVRGDGERAPMTRFYLIKGALERLDAALDSNPEARDAWDRLSTELVDLALEVIEDENGRGYFEDPGSPALVTVGAQHAARQLDRLRREGLLHQKMAEVYPETIEEQVTSRGFAAIVDVLRAVRANPAWLDLMDDLVLYFTEHQGESPRAALELVYSLLGFMTDQYGYDDVAGFLANVIDPERQFDPGLRVDAPLVSHMASLLARMIEVDEGDVGIDLIRRVLTNAPGGQAPLFELIDVVEAIERRSPGSSDPIEASDLKAILDWVAHFIRDDVRGLERVFALVQERSGTSGSREP